MIKKLQYRWNDGDEWVDYDKEADSMTVDDFEVGVEYGLTYRVIEVLEDGEVLD